MELDIADTSNTARGIASAWIIDHLRERWILIQNALGIGALVLFLFSLFVWPWLQALVMMGAVLMAIGWAGGVATRWLAMRLVRVVAAPRHFPEYEDEVAEALAEADLPTGPLSAIRFVWRLRRGVVAEKDRLVRLTRRVDQIISQGARSAGTPPPPPPRNPRSAEVPPPPETPGPAGS